MPDSYFTSNDGRWFQPTDHSRGPWDPMACHAGPPTALMARALEQLMPDLRLVRLNVELLRPIPMAGFRVQAEVRKPGRSVSYTEAEILDDDRVYARVYAMHMRKLDGFEVPTPNIAGPDLAEATPGPFAIGKPPHGFPAFPESVETRYAPGSAQEKLGPATVWLRTRVPILADEEPSPFQRICPLADCGNGLSYNETLHKVLFVNPDLQLSLHREPVGEWFASKSISHWQNDGTGMADSELFDTHGPVGRAVQNLLLNPRPPEP